MSQEILVNVTPQETRVGVIENGVLQEIQIERSRKRGLVGNIYRGQVSRVLPGMQAAFLEIGDLRTAFLHISDLDTPGTSVELPENCRRNSTAPIESLIREGDTLLVQVTKDPIGGKGARLTTQIALPSRLMVYLPRGGCTGVSQRIEQEEERERLRELVVSLAQEEGQERGGYIVRTAAEGASQEELAREIRFLHRLWDSIRKEAEQGNGVGLIYRDLPLEIRILRDQPSDGVERIRIDSREACHRVRAFADKFVPELAGCIEHYPGERPIMDLYSAEDEIQKALQRTVELKSGGHIVIDQTEAMTTIDINTGAFVGHRNLEETIFKTNLEAAQAIARQLRLRNLGGIIIIDFIDMHEPEHREQVLRALEKALERDHVKTTISEITSLGLVQLTRKRTRESLEQVLCESCPTCHGRGTIKTAQTVCYEILREILREARQFDTQQLLVVASPEVVDMLTEEESTSVAELESFINRPIKLQADSSYRQEQYDVVLL
ncbi:MAG: ribonuclease G [Gammaproteobacteria bacterium]|nr:MAG: ribonuclease G [Gammaproteobacteria bacterium]